ncbi:MAG: hypothetical protein JWR83_1184 [Aeromicrobium sp.]|nr:hypothetical protein [Aeromicrobium sp.]
MDDGFPSDSTFNSIFVVFIIVFVLAAVASVFIAARNWNAAKKAGYDPLTIQTDLATKAMSSGMMAPQKSLEDRLKEVDDLLARGVISAAEHATARAEILKG